MYKILIRFLGTDTAHRLQGRILRVISNSSILQVIVGFIWKSGISDKQELFGLTFPHRVGLGSGYDRNGELYNALFDFGFSFVETGSFTPLPQNGGLKNHPNKGVRYAIQNLRRTPQKGIIAAGITRNSKTEGEESVIRDYTSTFSLCYDFADMFVIHFAGSNTSRDRHSDANDFEGILDSILNTRLSYDKYKPVLVKIPKDMTLENVDELVNYCRMNGIDGVVAPGASTVRHIHEHTSGRFPIIGYGSIRTAEQAKEMLDAGASLIEVTTAFILDGPSTAKRLLKAIQA